MDYKKAPYTQEEIYILKKHYNRISMQELLVLLPNRTASSIYSKVNSLRKKGWTFNNGK